MSYYSLLYSEMIYISQSVCVYIYSKVYIYMYISCYFNDGFPQDMGYGI